MVLQSTCKHSSTITATLTADNHYSLYYGSASGYNLTFIGRNEVGWSHIPDTVPPVPSDPGSSGYNWSFPEVWEFTPGHNYLYVVTWDDVPDGPGIHAWLGEFQFQDGRKLLSNSQDWYYAVANGLNPGDDGEQPPKQEIIAEITNASWKPIQASASQGSMPWGTIPNISTDAQFIWGDTLDSPSISDGHYVIFRTMNPINIALPKPIFGTQKNDVLMGTNRADIIQGLEGDDNIQSHGGNDTVYGGNGNDWLKGGQDDDTLYGDNGNDTLLGGSGNDRLEGGNGADVLLGTELSAYPFTTFLFEDFSQPVSSLIQTNGDARFTNDRLRLTPDEASQVGSGVFKTPIPFNKDTSFSTQFQFCIGGQRAGSTDGADGLVFMVQNDPRGMGALGSDGSGLGYGGFGSWGGEPITNSIAISFDTFPYQLNNQGSVQILQGGSNMPILETNLPFNLASGEPFRAWIDYNGTQDLLEVYLSQNAKPDSPVLSYTTSIDNLIGTQGFFGFSAATGARFNTHDIEQWQLQVGCFELDRDTLMGGQGPDTFVLGGKGKRYYASGGNSDYALITDFSQEDRIQLAGKVVDYQLVSGISVSGAISTGLFLKGIDGTSNELIGFIQGVSGLNLNSNDFRFV